MLRVLLGLLAITLLLGPAEASAQSEATFQTGNGPRTPTQMAAELAGAGYNGPWDIGSVVAVYAQTTGAAVTPVSVGSAQTQTYNTHNGPRTADQLRSELATAGYGGPWDVNSMLAAYEQAAHPPCRLQSSDWVGDAWNVDFLGQAQLSGHIHNPCAEAIDVEIDTQLVNRTSQQVIGDARTATVQGLGSGQTATYSTWAEGLSTFGDYSSRTYWTWHRVADRSTGGCFDVGASRCLKADIWLAGALNRLLETTIGPRLLRAAADYGVVVQRAHTPVGSYGVFNAQRKTITIDLLMDHYSAWERATVLAHELRHAADAASGMNMVSTDGCYATEQNAFTDEAGVWSEFWHFQLPAPTNSVQTELNNIALTLARDPYAFIGDLLQTYKHQCGG